MNWTRDLAARTCSLALLAGVGVLGLGEPRAAAGPAKRPNVLILTTDQQRVDAMSAVGNAWVKTPHMDSMAAHGVTFTQSYCAFPLCSPSRSALHTGRTPHEIRVDRNAVPIDPAVPISGQVFRAAGYDTGYAGKWHLPEVYPKDGIAGFEVLNQTTRPRKLAHDVDEATMDASIEFLKRKRDRPFLLVVSFINPHDICLPAGENSPLLPDVWKKYQPAPDAKVPPLPANAGHPVGKPDNLRGPRHEEWSESQWQKYRYAYFRMVEDVDRQVGQVLAALRQTGQEDNTIVIFTSDHGEGLGSHRWTGKMMFYEEEAAVPLIVSWKGVTPAGRIDRDHLVSTLDVLPTICDYAGVQPPPAMRGESLRAVIEKPAQPGHEFVVSEMAGGGAVRAGRSFMVRTKQYKYMFFPGAERTEMLFDLVTDPGEMKNLAEEKTRAGELERHRRLLARWRQTTEEAKYPLQPVADAPRKKAKTRRGRRGRAQRCRPTMAKRLHPVAEPSRQSSPGRRLFRVGGLQRVLLAVWLVACATWNADAAERRIYVVTDLEGISGVYKFAQTRETDTPVARQAREFFMGDVAAVVRGLREGGATEIVVLDGHGNQAVLPELMAPGARYITGLPRPKTFPALDGTYAGVVFLGFHAMMGTPDGVLNHTQSSKSENRYWYNGVESGELAQCGAVAGHFGVPPILVTGDEATCREAERFFGRGCVTVAVKKGLARESAMLYPFAETRAKLRQGAKRAMAALSKCKPYRLSVPITAKKEYLVSEGALPPRRVTKEGKIPDALHLLDF